MSGFAQQIIGGPGIPAASCAQPVVEVTRPLGVVAPALRGAIKEPICPPECSKGPLEIVVDGRSWPGCVVPEVLVVTLGRKRLRECSGEECTAEPHQSESVDAFVAPRLRAVLEWGIGGGALECAEVDWLHGTQLSIAAERVTVQVRYDVITPPWAPSFDPCDLPRFAVNAGLSYGSTNRNTNPARLTEIVTIADVDGKARICVPNFAASFTVLLRGTSTATVRQLAFGTEFSSDHVFASPTTNLAGYYVENAIPLRGETEFLEIVNTSGNPNFVAYVIFGLTI